MTYLGITTITANRIDEVWFKALKACMKYGYVYTIDKGEFERQRRKELDFAVLRINTPWVRPLACSLPDITPTTDAKIEEYFHEYLLNPWFSDEIEARNNEYKYATWIAPAWELCCELLAVGKGGCNQATISLGCGTRFLHSPCLRMIDMRVRYGRLHFILAFRSWDLVSGYPENIGGLQLLKEACLGYTNEILLARGDEPLQDGCIIATTKGLHVYDHYWDILNNLTGEE